MSIVLEFKYSPALTQSLHNNKKKICSYHFLHYIVADFIYLIEVTLRGKTNTQKWFQSCSQADIVGPLHVCSWDPFPIVFHKVQLYVQFPLSTLGSQSQYENGR